MTTPLPIAIYDMDKTITRRPTFTPFLIYAAQARGCARLLLMPLVLGATFLYLVRVIGRARLKELNHALLIGRRLSSFDAAALSKGFAAVTLAQNIWPRAIERIARDRAEGRRLVLATASYAWYAQQLASGLDFDDVVATRCATDATGAVLAQIDGENCYGAAKRRMVEAWLVSAGIARAECHIRFYSDHVTDAPMFEWADEPVAVNAHGPLQALARARGWRMEDWRTATRGAAERAEA